MQSAADEAGLIDWDGAALDATHIKAQRSAAGARKTLPAAGKKGGRNRRVAGPFLPGASPAKSIYVSMDMGCPYRSLSRQDNAATRPTLGRFSMPSAWLAQAVVDHANGRGAFASIVLMAPDIIGSKFNPETSGVFVLSALMQKKSSAQRPTWRITATFRRRSLQGPQCR